MYSPAVRSDFAETLRDKIAYDLRQKSPISSPENPSLIQFYMCLIQN